MFQNGSKRPGSNLPRQRKLLILGLLLLALIIGGGSVIAYFVLENKGTASPGGSTGNGTGNGICTANSPYGFTTIHADEQLAAIYRQLNVCWVRYQVHWWNHNKKGGIESAPGQYNWSTLDTAVQEMNAAHIFIDFPIQDAPSWDRTQVCEGVSFLPGPQQMSQFASLIATRYNGKNGHGFINAFEIGNEEYDNYYQPGNSASLQCRNASYYGPVLQAGYSAIKQASPNALVGMFGMWYHNLPHIHDFMTYLFSHGYGKYMDYMNFHYYNDSGDPAVSVGSRPSFDVWWQTMHDIASQFGFAKLPIWVTETGWPDSNPQVQSQNLQYIMGQAANSHVIQKVFWFTINYGTQAKNIDPPVGPLPAFSTFKSIVQHQPQWNTSGSP